MTSPASGPGCRYLRRPRHRRHLVHALVRVAARGRRLRRRRLPRDRPGVRHARGGGGADRRGRRARDPDHRRRRPQPRLRPAPLVPGRARVASRLRRASAVLVPPRPRSERRRDADALAVQLLRADLDAHDEPRRHAGRVVPAPVLGGSSPTSTGTTPTSAASTRTSSGSGSTAARPASGSTRRPCWSRTRRCPRSRPSPGPASIPTPTATSSTTSIAAGARSPTRYPGTRILVGELWLPDVERFATYLRPDELHTAFNFDFMARPWDADAAARRRSTRRSPPTRRSARPRPGSSRTTTSPDRSPATGRRTASFAFVAQASRAPRPTSRSGAVGRAPPPSSSPRCRARSTSTRATSWASRRSRTCPSDQLEDPMHFRSGGVGPGPGRLPRAAALVGRRARRSGSARRAPSAEPWLRQPARWGALTVEAQRRRPGLDAQPLSRRAAHPPARARSRRRPAALARRRRTASSRSPAATASSRITNLSATPSRCRPGATSCSSQAPSSTTAGCQPTRRRGFGSTRTLSPDRPGGRQGKRNEEEPMTSGSPRRDDAGCAARMVQQRCMESE